MIEVFNSQEIFVHLREYRLVPPDQDEWRSIISALRVWLNCWFSSDTPAFTISQDWKQLDVRIDDEYRIRFIHDGNTLEILCTEDGQEDMNGDKYPFWRK